MRIALLTLTGAHRVGIPIAWDGLLQHPRPPPGDTSCGDRRQQGCTKELAHGSPEIRRFSPRLLQRWRVHSRCQETVGLVAAQCLPSPAVALEIRRGGARVRDPDLDHTHDSHAHGAPGAAEQSQRAPRAPVRAVSRRHPQASNREIASGVGVAHASQNSKLLSCLLGERLVARHSSGDGKRNAWWLTSYGEEVARALRAGSGPRLIWESSHDGS